MESVEKRETIATEGARDAARDEERVAVRDETREDKERATARRGVVAAVFSARTAYLVVGALVVGVAVGYLQFSTRAICCGDLDGYYHVRWSQLLFDGLLHGQFPPRFTWLPLTTLNPRDYVDHHLLFHLMQAPFTRFGNEIIGAKISAWLFASLAIFSCYWLTVRHRAPAPLLWLVVLLGASAPFLFRMSMTKAMSVSIVLLVVGINLLFRKKYLWLLPLAFIFTLTYDMFVLLGVAAAIWTCVIAWSERRFEWRPIVWVGVGIVAGIVINPYFPHDLRLLYQHAVMKIGVSDADRPSVGNEWYPYDSWVFLQNCAVAFLAMLVGYVTTDLHDRRRSARALFFLVFSTLLLIANAKWRRFAEYFPPFAVLFAAFSIEALLARRSSSVYGRLPDQLADELRPFLDSDTRAEDDSRARGWRRAEVEAAIISLLLGGFIFLLVEGVQIADSVQLPVRLPIALRLVVNLLLFILRLTSHLDFRVRVSIAAATFLVFAVVYLLTRGLARGALTVVFVALFVNAAFTVWIEGRTEIKDSSPPDEYQAGINWIRGNVPPGEIVFNTDWDDFPKLFFYDPTHAYVSGLDPTYLYDADHDLSKLYERITLGKEKDPGPLIRDRFHARYVFTDNEQVHDDFYNAALDSGWFEVVYEDKGGDKCNCTVLHIRDQKGKPPPDNGDSNDDDDTDQPDDNDNNDNNDNSARILRRHARTQLARSSSSTRKRIERGKASGE